MKNTILPPTTDGLTARKINGIWKLIWIRPMSAIRAKRVMRIYALTDARIPEEVLEETILGSGIFRNPADSTERFILQGEQLIILNNAPV